MLSSSIDLQFDELAGPLHEWYGRSVEAAALGMPPHVTLLYPWKNPTLEDVDLQRLEAALAPFEPFEVRFNRLETFSAGVVYLAFEDETVPRAMMKAIFTAFPDTPPYAGAFPDPSPHLTVAKCPPEQLDRWKDEIGSALDLPLSFSVQEVAVFEQGDNRRWSKRHTVRLRQP